MAKEPHCTLMALAAKVAVVLATAILLLVPTTALVGETAVPAKRVDGASFVIAWGNDGGCPAIALFGGLQEAPKEAVVLLPGSSSDGASLRVALQNLGVDTIAALFMPTGAPFPRGAKSLLKQFKLRRFVVAEDARSRTDWKPVMEKAMELGAVQERIQAKNGRIWHTTFSQWSMTYQKLPDSEIRGIISSDSQDGYYVFENRVTGEFVLSSVDAEGNSQELFCQPRTNRNGSVRIALQN